MRPVLESVPVRFYMDNGQPHTTTTYYAVMTTLRDRHEITYLEAVPRSLQLGSVTIQVLPLPPYPGSNLNNQSVGLVVQHGDFSAFLSGDSERRELQYWVASGAVPNVTLLKAPHHGSDDAIDRGFLQAADPEVVVVSVGGNTYGHPKPTALYAYGQYADQVLRTDIHGEVVVAGFPDGRYEVYAGGESVASGEGLSTPLQIPGGGLAVPQPRETADESMVRGGRGSISISVFADAPGNDHDNPNGEYAMLTNLTEAALDVSGWMLCDAASHCFRFPGGARMAAGRQVIVYTGSGASDGIRFFMGSGTAVWNNRGDTATLTDTEGRVIATYVY
jgi:competence protein ComEC